ncbi:hypothetical protein EG329_001767 [Mollisiaceae sp. DMI_Dod_QoI]|nr:hypothetical protein EG329_001767 [Helotiales sp. DMI_Dod_QoI]
MKFEVRSDLPCSVILGELDRGEFLGAAKETFNDSYESSTPMPRAATGPAPGSGSSAKKKTAKMPARRTKIDAPTALEPARKRRTARESSIKPPGNPLHNTSLAGQESPTSHGNITSSGTGRVQQLGPDTAQTSSMDEQEPKKRFRKREIVPMIRPAKLDASNDIDLSPAPGAEEYWTYDPGKKAYYHIDSNSNSKSGPIIWNPESDSEDSEA